MDENATSVATSFATNRSSLSNSGRNGKHLFTAALRFPSIAEQFLNMTCAIVVSGSFSALLGILIAYLTQVLGHHWFKR